MGLGGVAIAALPSVVHLQLTFSDRLGGVHTVFTIAVSIIGSIAIAAILDRCHLSYIFARERFLR